MTKNLSFLALVLTLLSGAAFAKTSPTKDPVELIDQAHQIQNFDFQKLFEEADKIYKISKAWKKIKCEPKTGFVCTKRECVKKDISTTLILDKKKELITRCDKEGNCEDFEAEFKQTGVFFNVQTEGPIGTVVRVFGDSRYKEITTVGLDAYISNGECLPVE